MWCERAVRLFMKTLFILYMLMNVLILYLCIWQTLLLESTYSALYFISRPMCSPGTGPKPNQHYPTGTSKIFAGLRFVQQCF